MPGAPTAFAGLMSAVEAGSRGPRLGPCGPGGGVRHLSFGQTHEFEINLANGGNWALFADDNWAGARKIGSNGPAPDKLHCLSPLALDAVSSLPCCLRSRLSNRRGSGQMVSGGRHRSSVSASIACEVPRKSGTTTPVSSGSLLSVS